MICPFLRKRAQAHQPLLCLFALITIEVLGKPPDYG